MKQSGKYILVTGGAGFIGSHVVDALLQEGACVVVVDNFDSFYDPGLKRMNLAPWNGEPRLSIVEADIRDVSAMKSVFDAHSIECVVHLAAKAGVRPSLVDPQSYYDVNLLGTLNIIERMKETGVRKLVFASSSSVYGDSPDVPFSEGHAVDHPISPYAASKKAAELLCYTAHHLNAFNVFCLRFFTVYGPRQRPEMAIHAFTRSIFEGRPITLYGDGSSRRDYTYINDIVKGVLSAIRRVRGYRIINLGESRTTTLLELVRHIELAANKKAQINWMPDQPGDVRQTCADITIARQILDYSPGTTVEEGVRQFVRWFEDIAALKSR